MRDKYVPGDLVKVRDSGDFTGKVGTVLLMESERIALVELEGPAVWGRNDHPFGVGYLEPVSEEEFAVGAVMSS